MAGIYIPGLEMLKCDECFWCIGHRIRCPAGSKDVLLGGRHPDCPLASVPPHGRLIDADALAVHKFAGAEHDISIADGGACYRRGWNDAIEAIMENAETIIGEK